MPLGAICCLFWKELGFIGVMGVAGVGVGGCSDSDAGVAPVWPPFLVAAAFCRSVSAMAETNG